ncbi:LANO_0G11276g1_1 [Lachancea nothofagi CBS 11611]|uniref:Multiple RNA-binding domain-containing protein 1 n=1 Tax=Lachancea nothofagi CBS 11611 TaxID=1266666 RepID=A0A1G4KJ72_9SACH|nr:LANO_0G11276g1_1 [Lachancea nothofagi CBS 11611]
MSRLIVKGLPKYLVEDRLKEHFSKRLAQIHQNEDISEAITDVKILKNRAGESRRFAFVGFRNESDAFDAASYFDQSFIDTCKVEVTVAKSFADPNVPQPMREKRREALKRLREREDKLLEEENAKKPKQQPRNTPRADLDAEIKSNKQLQEFIDTMKPSSKVASWDNLGGAVASTSDSQIPDSRPEAPQGNSLLAQALAMKSEDTSGRNDNGERRNADQFKLRENESDDEYTNLEGNQDTGEVAEEEPTVKLDDFKGGNDSAFAQDEQISDLDWLKQRRIRIKDRPEGAALDELAAPTHDIPEQETEEALDVVIEPEQQEVDTTEEEKVIEKIKSTGRLFLRNILYTATEVDFRNLFSPFGELDEVHVALDTRTGKSKGFAYVMFKNPDSAVNAYVELDKQIHQGRLLHILPADGKKSHRMDEFDLKNLPLKKQRALKRKANASQSAFSWNSLYMSQDAVLGSVASKLGLQKSDLIDATDAGAAVKQALAEAHVIGDVRKYFESKGMDLGKFEQLKSASDRDDTVILVKNFAFGTTLAELADLFTPFGKLQRLLMPPAQTIAVIQFRDVTAARAAFSKLSYKRFKDGILYLEKGPKNCFNREPKGDELVDDSQASENIDAKEAKATGEDVMHIGASSEVNEEATDDVLDGPTVSIFVKNLNFSTTSQQLSDKFRPFSGFAVAQVKTKPDPKNSGKTLSMGFGFAEFKTKEQAVAVINALDGSVLDGHRVQLKLSHRQGTATSASDKSKKKASGKIIVKNLPFEAERKQIFELFSSFGQLKSVRVPKKFDKSARGFAFVEFLLPKEAEHAMEQLQGVHLLGRRLVMQHAEQEPQDAEEQIARMTRKVKSQVTTQEHAAMRNGGRRKIDLEDEDDENNGLNGI